ATGSGATSLDETSVTARLEDAIAITTMTGTVAVTAAAEPGVAAEALGFKVGGAAMGASVALATAAPEVLAELGEDVTVSGSGALLVGAGMAPPEDDYTAYACGVVGSGGTLFGANATVVTALTE